MPEMESSIDLAATTGSCSSCGQEFEPGADFCPSHGPNVVVTPKIGELFEGRFEFVERIAAGGMGVVFKARQQELNRIVAIKILHTANASVTSVRRFQQEAQTLANLHHPNLVSVYELGVSRQGQPYSVMEFVDGCGLDHLIADKGHLHLAQAINIFLQVCEGLEYVHAHEILHRDMKPSNIMLMNPIDENPRVKLVDFGIAKVADNTLSKSLTQTGEVFGSPLYMSPEQAKGLTADERSDIYSLGCVIYEALSGVPPVNGQSVLEIIMKVVSAVPKPLNAVTRGVKYPNALEEIVRKLLEKEPVDRYQNITEVKEALNRFRTEHRLWYHANIPAVQFKRDRLWMLAAGVAVPCAIALIVSIAGSMEKHPALPNSLPKDDGMLTGSKLVEKAANTNPSDYVDLNLIEHRAGEKIDFPVGRIAPSQYVLLKRRANRYVTSFKVEDSTQLQDAAIEAIGDFPLLELRLDGSRITSASIPAISRMQTLEVLGLQDIPLSTADWRQLAKLTRLRQLNAQHTGIVEGGLKYFSAFKRLSRLNLKINQGVTDGGIQDLAAAKLPIVKLDLQETNITNQSIRWLAELPELMELSLEKTVVNDDAVASLNTMANLRSLNLRSTLFTSKGLSNLHLPRLLKLKLSNQRGFSPAALAQFHQLNHECMIVWDDSDEDTDLEM